MLYGVLKPRIILSRIYDPQQLNMIFYTRIDSLINIMISFGNTWRTLSVVYTGFNLR